MKLLISELPVGSLTLKNRLVMPPMATPKNENNGLATDEVCKYYAEKSQGGFLGLVITEHCYVSIEGKAHNGQLSLADDSTVAGLAQLTQSIHKNGTPVFAQLNHAGGRTQKEITGTRAVAPSAVVLPRSKEGIPIAQAMTAQDIQKAVMDFAQAARRAKQADYDGVEIHSAHGYLLNQFFSPLSNRRTDAYAGKTLEGRLRLHLEILAAIRTEVGNEYPIALRLAACDFMEGGITPEDAVWAAKRLESAGLDLLDISGGFGGYTNPGHMEPGYFSPLSQAVKQAVNIPVLLTGGVQTGTDAECLLEDGKADLIGVGRALLKNSAWAKEAITAVQTM